MTFFKYSKNAVLEMQCYMYIIQHALIPRTVVVRRLKTHTHTHQYNFCKLKGQLQKHYVVFRKFHMSDTHNRVRHSRQQINFYSA